MPLRVLRPRDENRTPLVHRLKCTPTRVDEPVILPLVVLATHVTEGTQGAILLAGRGCRLQGGPPEPLPIGNPLLELVFESHTTCQCTGRHVALFPRVGIDVVQFHQSGFRARPVCSGDNSSGSGTRPGDW